MKFSLGKFLLAVFLNVTLLAHTAQAELSQITFEEVEWVPLGTISNSNHAGWNVYSGNAVVTPNGQGYQGGKALKLPASQEPEAMVSRQIQWNPSQQTAFIDVRIKPAADPEGSLATFYSNGTQLAFQVNDLGVGSIWVYHGNDEVTDPAVQPEQWVKTAGSFNVQPGATEADAYVRITLRHDYQRDLWDLFVDGKMAAANLSFEGRSDNLSGVDFYGSLTGDTRVDNLSALETNMLFPDADKDGLPDAWETANGSNPNLYDRDNLKAGTNTSFLDLYMASLWGGGAVNANKSIPSPGGIPPLSILGNHQPVGALKGSFSVEGEGDARFNMPIDVPKGTAGMEPKLSLGYSSKAGNGIVGLGWNLNGLQKITRGPSSDKKDGSYDPADFDSSDRYFLDGELLVLVTTGGIYGAAGTEYRTEFDSYSRITAIGTASVGSGPSSWKVETKAGLVIYLGATAASKTQVPQGTLAWSVNQVMDTVGNYYSVDYATDSNSGKPFDYINQRISAVHYTGNGSMEPYCHILFDYEERPDATRAYTTYAGYRLSKRLAKIFVKTDSFINHSYRLSYTTSYQTGRSLLSSITKLMQDDPALAIPSTTFNYDGLQEGQAIWLDPGSSELPTYSTNVDATEYVNSMVTAEEGNTTLRLTGDVSRAYKIPGGVTVYPDTKIQFEYKASSTSVSSVIGLDTDTIYQLPFTFVSTQTPLYRIGGTGSLRLAPNEDGRDPYFRGTAQPYNGGWQTYTLDATKFGSGLLNYLVMMCADDTMLDGINEAWFRNVRFFRSGSQQASDVSPIIFNFDTDLPRYFNADGKDLGVVSMDLNADGLPDLSDWRVIDYTLSGTQLTPQIVGNTFKNTGNGFVSDINLALPGPLSVRNTTEAAYKYNEKHHLLAQPMDVNGDGRPDLLISSNIQKSGSVLKNEYVFYTNVDGSWFPMSGYDLPFRIENTSSDDSYGGKRRDHHFQWIDLNADGFLDLSICTTAYGRIYDKATNTLIAGGTSSIVYMNKGKEGPGWVRDDSLRLPEALMWFDGNNLKDLGRRVLDLDGDGIPEIAEAFYDGNAQTHHTYRMLPTGTYRWNSTVGAQNPPASVYDLPVGLVNASGVDKRGPQIFDCNGDGLPDILQAARTSIGYLKNTWINQGYRTASPWVLEAVPSTTEEQKSSYVLPLPMHMPVDGDAVVSYGFEKMDLNGDGLVDILYSNEPSSYTSSSDNLALLNTGSGWALRPEWGLPGGNLICSSDLDREKGKRRAKLQDINGDGFPDLITNILNQTPRVWYNQCRPEVMTSTTDGFGSQVLVEYKRLNDPTPTAGFGTRVYERGTPDASGVGGTIPVSDSRLVVSRYSQPDGLTPNSRRWKAQRYADLRYDSINSVSLGFGRIEVMDELTGQVTKTETYRNYPLNGSPKSTRAYVLVTSADLNANGLGSKLPGVTPGLKLMSEELSEYGELASQSGTGGTIRRIVQTKSIKRSFDLTEALKAQIITTQSENDFDEYGFIKKSVTTTLDGDTQETKNNYYHQNAPGSPWILGRLTLAEVTKTRGSSTIVKKSSFSYDSNGLLSSETIQPGHALSITNTYIRGAEAFGNITSTTTSASGSERISLTEYDSRGRFVTKQTNPKGHIEQYSYDSTRALLASSKDANDLVSTYTYDSFGTVILTHHPDGTKTGEITGYANNASLPASVSSKTSNPIKYFRAQQSSGRPVVKIYLDAMGRELVTETTILRNAGSSIYSQVYVVTCYDSRGRKIAVSEPFAANENPLYTSVSYDMLDRQILTVYPDNSKDEVKEFSLKNVGEGSYPDETLSSGVPTHPHSYSRVANRNGMVLERWENQHAELAFSRDPSNKFTKFLYDQESRLLSVHVGGEHLLSNTFDLLGNKTSVWEANSGTSTSAYTGFAEVKSSTNAKGEETLFNYDELGRVTELKRPEGTFYHLYDGAPGKGIGKHWKTTGPNGYQDLTEYDDLGRVKKSIRNQFGEEFVTKASYTALGLPLMETDAGGLEIVHEYDPTYSFPRKLKIGTGIEGGGTVLWEAGTYDSKGRPLSQKLALGITASGTYNPNSGQLESLKASVGGTWLQNKICSWDAQGNLISRTDLLSGRSEEFGYDNLNRVTTALVKDNVNAPVSTQNYTYDEKGNLLSKAGANLIYTGTRPHAVASATVKGVSRSYEYDAAGYVTLDSKRSYTWTSFGQLKSVTYAAAPALSDLSGTSLFGSATVRSSFDFDAGSNRMRQLKERISSTDSRALEETTYLGAYEREVHSSAVSGSSGFTATKTVHRHSLGGIGTYVKAVDVANGTTIKLTTVLKDHLGTTSVLYTGTWTGSAFSILQTELQSFDPWGERRDANTWANFRSSDGDAFRRSSQDHDRGFTGHEQLDDSGLIHMNGRIYDPEIGRFLSPDPFVQVPEYSQNFNRYSYVLNNPLNTIDPSGFSWLTKQFHKLGNWLGEDWCKVVVIVVYAVVWVYAGPQAAAASSAGLSTALNGGSQSDVGKAGAIAYAASWATTGVGEYASATANAYGGATGAAAGGAIQVVGTAVINGAANAAMGGKFEDGFISGAVSSAMFVGAGYVGADRVVGEIGVHAIVGGTMAEMGGGKFANGAAWAAFEYLAFGAITSGLASQTTGANLEVQDTESIPMEAAFKKRLVMDFNPDGSVNMGQPTDPTLAAIEVFAIDRGIRGILGLTGRALGFGRAVIWAPVARAAPQGAARIVPQIGSKLEYFLGNATGNAHNIERSRAMLAQLQRVGLPDSPATREFLKSHLDSILNNATTIVRTQANGRIVRESLIMGPRGALKLETVWEGAKLITGNFFGGY